MPANPKAIPRGIEVLVKKASVDPEFRAVLLARRAEAASEIGLALEPSEAAMLGAIPAAQLEAIIARTTVDPMSRAAFLGKAAALMLAALGAGVGCDEDQAFSRGARPGGEVLYQETDYKGAVTYGYAEERAFRARQAEVDRLNKLRPEAYTLARRAWEGDPSHKGTSFPMDPPLIGVQCDLLRVYYNHAELLKDMEWRRAQLREEAEEERKREESQRAALSEQQRREELASSEHRRAAERLFEEKLGALASGESPEKGTPAAKSPAESHRFPPVTDGIRPDRP